jgi:hypothetical protein
MRLSVPSYVIPGTYLENILHLKPFSHIQGVELLFFYYDEQTKVLLDAEWDGIQKLADRFFYTIHLPDVVYAHHEELVDRFSSLATHYIVHPPRYADSPSLKEFIPKWRATYGDRFLLENTTMNNFLHAEPELDHIPICCDLGHLLLEHASIMDFLGRYEHRIKQIHLHDVVIQDGKPVDHKALQPSSIQPDGWLTEISPWLSNFQGVLELEIFHHNDVNQSCQLLSDLSILKNPWSEIPTGKGTLWC